MRIKNKKKLFRILFWCTAIVLIVAVGIVCVPLTRLLRSESGRELIGSKVSSFGAFAPLVYVLFCIVQVIVAVIPGEPIEIMGGVLFGTWGGLACSVIGTFIGTVIVYMLVSKYGQKLVFAVIPQDKWQKLWNKFKITENPRNLEILVFILFLTPGTPKDALTYIIPLTKISRKRYFLLATFARIPSIVTSTFVGASLGNGNIKMSIAVFAATAVLGLVCILIRRKQTPKQS
jgi:uncharacterized membrane protein YdjX (TVP38/TMEM64 family)